ncbi:MAG: ClpXP protease specificity-enhancing factor [Betaproteobacteria bacterium]|nr:ClpXP protease specificity-enhancing factor [Betaproteobacteria bacterium]
MVSTKPYLIRAMYQWCVDQGFTPYLTVQVSEHTRVPPGYVREGQIVLNIGPEATHQLKIDNEQVTFQARFNGVVHQIAAPINSIAAIYARENGQGMAFEIREHDAPENIHAEKAPNLSGTGSKPQDEYPPPPPPPRPRPRGSHLKVVK